MAGLQQNSNAGKQRMTAIGILIKQCLGKLLSFIRALVKTS